MYCESTHELNSEETRMNLCLDCIFWTKILLVFLVQELLIYSERWLGCQKSYDEVRMRIRTRRRKMTNSTYIAVDAVFKTIQSKAPFQILLHKLIIHYHLQYRLC